MAEWDELFRRGFFPLEEPQQQVVKLSELLRSRKMRRICDMGCGPGRNLVFLAKQGFEVYGIDISENALERARKRANELRLNVQLKKADMTSVPFPDSFFDAVMCVYAIYHNTLDGMRRTISEVRRILTPGGLVLVTFQTKRSHKYRLGKEIEADTFIQDQPPEVGILHHFSDEQEVRRLMQDFEILSLELEEFVWKDSKVHSHWQVLAQKQN